MAGAALIWLSGLKAGEFTRTSTNGAVEAQANTLLCNMINHDTVAVTIDKI